MKKRLAFQAASYHLYLSYRSCLLQIGQLHRFEKPLVVANGSLYDRSHRRAFRASTLLFLQLKLPVLLPDFHGLHLLPQEMLPAQAYSDNHFERNKVI